MRRLPILPVGLTALLFVGLTALSCSAPQARPPASPEHVEAAKRELRAGLDAARRSQHEEALTHFETARRNAWSPQVDVHIARTLAELDRPAAACVSWLTLALDTTLTEQAAEKVDGAADALLEVEREAGTCWKQGRGLPAPRQGPADAKVTLLLVGNAHSRLLKTEVPAIIAAIRERHPDAVSVQWLTSLENIGDDPLPAERAALAAHLQGKFWVMQRYMLDRQRELRSADFEEWAKEAGLDVPRFRADLSRPGLDAALRRSTRLAAALGVPTGPALLVNGRRVSDILSATEVSRAIDEALSEKPSAKAPALYTALWLEGRALDRQRARPTVRVTPREEPPADLPRQTWRVPTAPTDLHLGKAKAGVAIIWFADPLAAGRGRTLAALRPYLAGNKHTVVVQFLGDTEAHLSLAVAANRMAGHPGALRFLIGLFSKPIPRTPEQARQQVASTMIQFDDPPVAMGPATPVELERLARQRASAWSVMAAEEGALFVSGLRTSVTPSPDELLTAVRLAGAMAKTPATGAGNGLSRPELGAVVAAQATGKTPRLTAFLNAGSDAGKRLTRALNTLDSASVTVSIHGRDVPLLQRALSQTWPLLLLNGRVVQRPVRTPAELRDLLARHKP